MELELHQLELRYEALRKRAPAAERQLLGSLAELGQQLPIVVVSEAARFVLIDGYKRVRALKRLARDTVRATGWQMPEVEALLLERRMRCASEDAFDQAWLLAELRTRFGLSLEELARRFEHHKSWVSRRLALVQILPATIQDSVRSGTLAAHAAMKYLVPLARANAQAATRLAEAIAPLKPTSREVGALYAGWQSGTARTRELILATPQVYLQAQATQSPVAPSAAQRWLNDLGALAGIARRARRGLEQGLLQRLLEAERREIAQAVVGSKAEVKRLFERFDLEAGHAG
jgi:ParB family transcriptional regulator, chromosome partitioning protein